MVDPTRRKQLASGTPPSLTIVASEVPDDYILRSYHETSPGYVDLREFFEGRGDVIRGPGSADWLGGFRARPQLLLDMLPTLRRRHRQSRRTVITTAVPTSLRSIWRFLDTLDDVEGLRVESLSDVNDLHGTQYLRSNPRYSDYVAVKGYIVHSRQEIGRAHV